MAKKPNMLSGVSNARTRTFIILFGAIIAVGVGFAFMRGKQNVGGDVLSKQGSQSIGVPTEIKATPGGAASEQYREKILAENERQAQEALKKKTSAIPTIIGAISESGGQKKGLGDGTAGPNASQTKIQFGQMDDTGFLTETGPFAKTSQELERERQEKRIKEQRDYLEKMRKDKEQAAQLQVQQDQQRKTADQEQKAYQESLQKTQQQMKSYASGMYTEWAKYPTQVYVQGELATKTTSTTTTTTTVTGSGDTTPGHVEHNFSNTITRNGVAGERAALVKKQKAFIKAGTILFGVLDTSVNSDEPGPILASIVSGKYQGAKLIGSLIHEPQQEGITLTFNVMSLPKAATSMGVQAVAIDPDTARTALASDVDKHYLLRYGMLFASSMLSGYGKAVMASGSTTSISPLTGQTTTSTPPLDNEDLVKAALGEFGTKLGEVTKKYFDTPYTVTINQGTGVGILFLTDVEITDKT